MSFEDHAASAIYHRGPLLAAVQSASLWPDSKTFVDCPTRGSASVVLASFEAAQRNGGAAPLELEALSAFVSRSFAAPGAELEACEPADWQEEVGWFAELPAEAAEFARALHQLWRTLCRKSVSPPGCTSSLLPLPHPFFIPGDRFRETYYWDTFWIVRGLLASELHASAHGVCLNLLHLLDAHGFVPNGARSYYLLRSQPPLLSHMVAAVHARTPGGCAPLLARALPLLQREWAFWTSGQRSVLVRTSSAVHRLSRYFASQAVPRPESWREDVATCAGLAPAAAAALHVELASAAESGWDFSSRWLEGASLRTLRTTRTVPADLNAFLLALARHIAAFARALGQARIAEEFDVHAEAQAMAIKTVLWNETAAQWRDFVLDPAPGAGEHTGRPSTALVASNWVPLWCGAVAPDSPEAARCVASLAASGLIQPGGLATSDVDSGEQWDAPNSWPPLVHMLAEGCARCGDPGRRLGSHIAGCYLRTTRLGWAAAGQMHEKYDARRADGGRGGGGEYAPQVGFGWTNGACLALLQDGLGVAEAWPGA